MSKKQIEIFDINENKQIFKIHSNQYTKIKTLGEGGCGKVFLVKQENFFNDEDSKYFALKINKRFKIIEDDVKNEEEKPKEISFIELRELYILKKLKGHPNVIDLVAYDIDKEDHAIWLLMDYIPIDLGKFFFENKNNPEIMNEKFFKNIAYQILSGVKYIHINNIIHCDLKLENILYDKKKNIVKIIDFGLSREYDYDISNQYSDVGTYPYKPCEVMLGLRHFSPSFDIWSVGCIFVEIVIGFHLFGKDNSKSVIKLMCELFGSFNDEILPQYKYFPKSKLLEELNEIKGFGLLNFIKKNKKFEFENNNFYDLIEKMLCIDPLKRISAKECLSHSWFSNMNI